VKPMKSDSKYDSKSYRRQPLKQALFRKRKKNGELR
jgi:hypothetical protein